jgi:hypothetical protein
VNGLPLWLATALYIWQGFEYYKLGQPGNTLAFVAYATANLGFIWQLHLTTA